MMDEQGVGANLTGWGNNTQYYEGTDDGGLEYVLPEGYSVGKTVIKESAIFDEKNKYCGIVNKDGKIYLVSPTRMIEIKEADAI